MKKQRKRLKNPRIRSDGYAQSIVYSLDIDNIRANSAQPRRDFDIDAIIKLADSIRRYGILQPLSVRRVKPLAPESHKTVKEDRHSHVNLVADVLAASLSQDVSRETNTQTVEETKGTPPTNPNVSHETWQNDPQTAAELPEQGLSVSLFDIFDDEQPLFPLQNKPLSADNTPPPPEVAQSPAASPILPDDTGLYELVAGERRLRAAKMLGMKSVPCIIVNVDDAISAELALVENMLRENLNMFEQAEAFSHLAEKYALTQEEIAAKMSLSQSAVANKIRLLKLEAEERQLIMEAGLTERHARAFLRLPAGELRGTCIQRVIDDRLNVSETDKYISNLLQKTAEEAQKPTTKTTPTLAPEKLCSNIYKFVNRMQNVSGNCLTVNRRSDGGNVIITLTVRKGS